jgi:flagellar motor switch protein FliM
MLGRPTHLLEGFGEVLTQRLDAFFEARMGRRRGTRLTVRRVSFVSHATDLSALPWRQETFGRAAIGIHLERALLLTLLELRYGPATTTATERAADATERAADATEPSPADGESDTEAPADQTSAPSAPAPSRETSTERRLGARLAAELARALSAAIPHDEPTDPPDSAADTDTPVPLHDPRLFAVCTVADARDQAIGEIHFALDDTWQQRLFRHLTATQRRPATVKRQHPPLSTQLRLKLTAQLMEIDVPFGDVLRLRPGVVLPVRLHASARVLANDTPLFTARVAECNGKLCLTSFAYVE